ncbi:MAG: HAD-IC family P-type ATPase, partial [Clostridia bacterium]|nr:HAD-IC family P-type ATPase [Clostridia bacterium]
ILVRQNELVPIDGYVVGESGLLDTVLLTGDTAPKYVFAGDQVCAGMVVTSETLQLVTTCSYADSTAQRVTRFMYDDSADESRESEFARKFSTAFGIVVLVLGLALGIVPSLLTGNWHEWMRIAFTFMILAGTGELLLQGPLCFENGLGTAFYNGVLVRGDGPFEQLANAEKVVFNKTGTLTKGEPDVIDIIPAEGYKAATLLEMAAKAEALSGHRIADCIRKAYGKEIDEEELIGFTETPGLGVIVYVDGHRLVAGNARCMLAEGIDVRESHQAGNKLHVAVDQKYMGCIVTSDNARKDSEETIKGLHDMGLTGITMLTGGARGPSKLLSEELSIDEFGAELAPEDKLAALQTFTRNLQKNGTLVFVGDGEKDRILLDYADGGIALNGVRYPHIIDTVDTVVMPEAPSRVVGTLRTARRTFQAARTNTILVIVLKAVVMVLAVVGLAGIWAAPLVTLISAIVTAIYCRRIRAGWDK